MDGELPDTMTVWIDGEQRQRRFTVDIIETSGGRVSQLVPELYSGEVICRTVDGQVHIVRSPIDRGPFPSFADDQLPPGFMWGEAGDALRRKCQ